MEKESKHTKKEPLEINPLYFHKKCKKDYFFYCFYVIIKHVF